MKQRQGYLFLTYFFMLSPKMTSVITTRRDFSQTRKSVFSKSYFFPLCMWNQFPLIETYLGIQT